MKLLKDNEEKKAFRYIKMAAEEAKAATCTRALCGTVIVKDNKIIGKGYNSPPRNIEKQRRCENSKESYDKKVTDKTCCIHAEQRAIFDALSHYPDKIEGATLYFTRVNKEGKLLLSGKPYCTICSKSALDVGISEFVLYQEEGICVYETEEYNILSYAYQEVK